MTDEQKTLLIRVRDHILAEPKRVAMDIFVLDITANQGGPACGTVACIAGWAAKLGRPAEQVNDNNAERIACELLGFPWRDSDSLPSDILFMPTDWPPSFKAKLNACYHGTPEYAKVVAERIDYFIETER